MTGRKRGALLNTTSMLDVIFILLIFFVAVSKIRDGSLDLRLPEARGEATDDRNRDASDLVITIDRDDQITLGSRSIEDVNGLARLLHEENEASAPDRPVIFIADRASHSGPLVGALKAVTDAGFRNVSFLYQPRREAE